MQQIEQCVERSINNINSYAWHRRYRSMTHSKPEPQTAMTSRREMMDALPIRPLFTSLLMQWTFSRMRISVANFESDRFAGGRLQYYNRYLAL